MKWTCELVMIGGLWAAPPVISQISLFSDTFESYARGDYLDLRWQVESGQWDASGGSLIGRAADRGTCWASASPVAADQEISVLLTPGERVRDGAWAAAALVLWAGPSDFWRLSLVDAPDGRRYAELLESRAGRWQAQNDGSAALAVLPDGVDGFEWQTGHAYRLRLRVDAARIRGTITDDDTGDVVFRRGYRLPPDANAVRRGRAGVMVESLEAAFDDVRATGVPSRRARAARAAAILATGMPDASPAVIDGLRQALADAGIECRDVSPSEFAGDPDLAQLVILPHTKRLPLGVLDALDAHLRRGGLAIFMGGPLGAETLVEQGGEWLQLDDALAQTPTGASLLTLDQTTTDALRRQAGPEEGATSLAILKGPDGQPALGVKVGDLQSWETLEYRLQSPGFPEGHELTCFWAKGSRKTTHLTVEWREDDKSRWMATVGLTPSWERYVLAPRDFKYWPDNVAQGRGDGGDHLRPAHAAAFMFGLAKSHAALPEGPHSYAIAEIGTAASPYPSLLAQAPIIEAVSPPYKTFAPTSARKITGPDVDLPATSNISCAIPRARGLGIRKARIGRWIPLLEARDAKGDLRGIAGSVYISLAEPYPGAAWGTIGIEGPEYIERHMDPIGPVVAGMARRLLGRVHISKAGADQFSYLPGEAPIIGGQIANDSDRGQELHLDMTVTQVGHAAPAFTKTWAISALPGVLTGESARWDRPTEHGTYVARAVLRQGDEVLDELSHSFVRLATPEAASSAYVSVRDGEFWLAGKRWHPHGINYWPSSSTALEWFSYWLHWLHPTNYDPSVIERDLAALADLKMNSVSIALRNRDELPAFNHFASRCAEHGVRINLFVGGGDPVGFNVESTLDLIEAGHLASNPTIYAWDISWEPHFGPFENRLRLDAWWDEWIAERYGSVENAEADWGVDAPRAAGGQITGPSQEQILNDGDHRVMVAAYRRFLDDLVSRSYGEWARKVRAVDPHHLIGVRSGYGGTGQAGIDHAMPFDLMAGAKHLDFISPEGYGIGGDWENYERGGFTTAYARFAGNGRPVFWSEFGRSIHPEYSSERIEEQRLLYERTYRMVAWSGANGSAGWWFPGGFRVGENSDYGIMNPDGTPRPSALDARKWAARIDDLKHVPEVTHWITIDGDLHPRGYSQVIARHADEYVSARRRGEIVGLRAEGTGTDSTATSMTAVGNTRADGANPHKYLNAEFNTVRVRVGGGAWIDATPGATVEVEANRAIECVATIGNSGEALWVSPAIAGDRPGGVYLVDAPGSDLVVDQPITIDVPRYGDTLVGPFELSAGIDAKANVALRVEARGRTPFGGHFRFALAPR